MCRSIVQRPRRPCSRSTLRREHNVQIGATPRSSRPTTDRRSSTISTPDAATATLADFENFVKLT